jgi:hypothetical protein
MSRCGCSVSRSCRFGGVGPVRLGAMVADAHPAGEPLAVTSLWIGVGGFVEALTRYLLDTEIATRLSAVFPFGRWWST